MALSKALVQSFRKNTLMVGAGWRVAFAPFNIALNAATADSTQGPAILDLQNQGPFNTNALPAGWFDLGWIKDYKITPQSKIGQIRSGYRGAVRQQYRGQVGENFEFKFREFTRMAYKISTGCEIFNLLKGTTSTVGPLSASGNTAVPLFASGYQANGAGTVVGSPAVFVPAGSGTLFTAGDDIVVDVDYDKASTGFVGDAGIPIYVNNAPNDTDFIRKTSDYVARITRIVANAVTGGDALVLSGPIVGGGSAATGTPRTSPPNTAKVQKINGWAAREGGTFLTEWSALFILDSVDGDQMVQYYPHVSISQFRDFAPYAIENIGTTDMSGFELDCVMEALAYDDPEDGETVVCYRAYYPNVGQDIAI